MNSKDLISVIVPIYNVKEYLFECLNSIKNQIYENIEVILIDDGSTDGSDLIALKFVNNDSRFKYFRTDNKGISSARNLGLEKVSGDFIYFLDSDDYISNDYLASMYSKMDENVDIVISKCTICDLLVDKKYILGGNQNKNDFSLSSFNKEKEILERLINSYPKNGYIITSSIMPLWKNLYRTTLIKNNKIEFIDYNICAPEDYLFNLVAYYYSDTVVFINHTGYFHNVRSKSLSRVWNKNNLDKMINTISYVQNFIDTHDFFNVERIRKCFIEFKFTSLIGNIYNIIESREKYKRKLILSLFKKQDFKNLIYNAKNLNVENKYLIIRFLLKYFGINFTIIVLKIFKKNYYLYRKIKKK